MGDKSAKKKKKKELDYRLFMKAKKKSEQKKTHTTPSPHPLADLCSYFGRFSAEGKESGAWVGCWLRELQMILGEVQISANEGVYGAWLVSVEYLDVVFCFAECVLRETVNLNLPKTC